jgi:lipoprotein-releasing system ATP-binding protein
VLQVASLGKSYATPRGPLRVLSDVSFSLSPGEAAAITGPSGSGKSTLLYVLGALEPPSDGEVTLGGQNPFALDAGDAAAFRNRRIGFVFQDHSLLPQCTVLENVLVPTLVAANGPQVANGPAKAGPYVRGAGGPAEAGPYVQLAQTLLEQVGLSGRLEHRPAELSGGEKQRVAIARALIRQPELVLCDEPTGNLDSASASAVASLLLDLHRTHRNILIVVTHSESLASRFPIRFEIADGRVRRTDGMTN